MAFSNGYPGSRLARNCWTIITIFAIWLAFPNDLESWPLAVLLWPAGLVCIGRHSSSLKDALGHGWLATFCGMEASLYWLCMPIAQVGGLPWPLAILTSLFIPALLALQGGIFTVFTRMIVERPPLLQASLAALAWYLLELGFAWLVGFPWLPIAGSLAQWPALIQLASICGSFFTGAIWLFATLCILSPILGANKFKIRISLSAGGLILVTLLCWHGYSTLLKTSRLTEPDAPGIATALIVEGNIDQNQKWTPPFQKKSLDTYIDITNQGMLFSATKGVKNPLVLWPETAMPFFYETSPLLRSQLEEAVRGWSIPLVFGAPGLTQDKSEEEVYNRAFLLGPSGKILGYYDKVHLVPFGEYLPAWLRIEFLEALLQGVGIYRSGTSAESLNYGNLALGILICYEAIFPWLARDRVEKGANIFVDISNDGWFGRTPACRQHLYLTALRCIEQNRWLWRATNTGISAVIDNHSRIIESGPQFQAGFMLWEARLEATRSIFYHIGNWLPWLVCCVFCAMLPLGQSGRR